MTTRWMASEDGNEVHCDYRGDGLKTITVREHDLPAKAWRVAQLMNDAYKIGYAQAQRDIQLALGIGK